MYHAALYFAKQDDRTQEMPLKLSQRDVLYSYSVSLLLMRVIKDIKKMLLGNHTDEY